MQRHLDRMKLRAAALWADRSGLAAIEFAAVAPMILLMVACAIDLGFLLNVKTSVRNAAQAGAHYAMMHGFKESNVATIVSGTTPRISIAATPTPTKFCACAATKALTEVTCGATCTGGKPAGTYARVNATATTATLLPYPLLPKSFTFTSQSTVRLQ